MSELSTATVADASKPTSRPEGDKPDAVTSGYEEMIEDWELTDALLGGTRTMRAAGTKFLPREPEEDDDTYQGRLNRSVLYNAYADTLEKLEGKPFSKPVAVKGKPPERLTYLLENMDGCGASLTAFARECFRRGMHRGLRHVLVDKPQNPKRKNNPKALPYFVPIDPKDLWGWRWRRKADGTKELIQIRIHEARTEPKGKFGDRAVHYIRIINAPLFDDRDRPLGKGTWELWRKDPDGDEGYQPVPVSEGGTGFHDYPGVPLRTCPLNPTGFMTALPVLSDLAYLNLAHWQSDSDQRHNLHHARVPVLTRIGISKEEMKNRVVLSSSRAISSTNEKARIAWLELQGQSLPMGFKDLEDLENRMRTLGHQPFQQRTGNPTATGRALDESRTESSIQSWIRGQEDFLVDLFACAAIWEGVELPGDFRFDIYSDFPLSLRSGDELDHLLESYNSGGIDQQTYLEEVKRRQVISEDTTVEEIMERTRQAGPPLAELPAPAGGAE